MTGSNVFDFPFSGAVSQAINPWSWWTNIANSPTGLININNYKSSAPGTEQRIVREAAGYGMQLGRISEALEAVIAFLPKTGLSGEQKEAYSAFTEMADKIHVVKQQAALDALSPSGIDAFLSNLEALKETDKEAYARAAARLKSALK